MFIRNKISVVLIGMTLLLGSFVFAQDDGSIVAVVGNRKISKEEFEKRYREVKEKTLNPPSKELFLEDLVRYEVGVQEAEKRNLEKDPIVQERIRQILYVDLVEKELGKKADKISISESDMQSFYSKNPEIRTSHILIEIKERSTRKDTDIVKQRAEKIYQEVKSSKKPFEQLAKLYSDDVVSKKNGGDIGWHGSSTLIPDYYQAAIKLKNNQISGLIETKFGFHIIKMTGIKSFKEADKTKLRASVFDLKKKALFDGLFDKLKSQYSIKTFPNNI